MRIGLATMRDLPAWEIDDRPLTAALAARGADVEHPVWDDPEVDWSRFDAVLIRTTWDYQDQLAAFLAWAEHVEQATRLLHRASVVAWNTHKSYLRDLQRRGAPIAPTAWLARGQTVDVAAVCDERRWSRGFVKPMVGSTARETLRFAADPDGLRAAQAHVDRLLPREDLMLQPYLDSVEEVGELSLILIDGEVSHGVRKVPRAGDYRVQDDFGAHDEPHGFAADEVDIALGIVDAARLELELRADALLFARVDFLRAADGRMLLNELELVEPSLFFRHGPGAAERLADGLLARAVG